MVSLVLFTSVPTEGPGGPSPLSGYDQAMQTPAVSNYFSSIPPLLGESEGALEGL